ncbi:hypothetical protein [Mangrovibacterium marinum]|uniref:hypothetical protein n=1 Tax=Mangrovibacterium marinum TaxID=1639118 RepID=UPI002A18D515|nr:hypothetical protein [Mangrovibacterium marinum]
MLLIPMLLFCFVSFGADPLSVVADTTITAGTYNEVTVGENAELTVTGDLTVNDTLVVYGQLIVQGNLSIGNKGVLITHDEATVVIFKSASLSNKSKLSLSSYFIVLENLTKQGDEKDKHVDADVEDASIYVFGAIDGFGEVLTKCPEDQYDGVTEDELNPCDAGGFEDFVKNVDPDDLPDGVYDQIVFDCDVSYSLTIEGSAYRVLVKVKPTEIVISQDDCPYGYGYQIEFVYSVLVEGTMSDADKLTYLNGYLKCDENESYFSLPIVTSSGVVLSNNQYRNHSDCDIVSPSSLCSDLRFEYGAQNTDHQVILSPGEDNIPPKITCPPQSEIDCYNNLPVISTIQQFEAAGGHVTDNCSSNDELSLVWDQEDDEIHQAEGENACYVTRKFIITDASGNSSSCEQVIVITDNTAPTLDDILDGGTLAAYAIDFPDCQVEIPFPNVTETCSSVSYLVTDKDGNVNPNYGFDAATNKVLGSFSASTTIKWTITDDCGHSVSAYQDVIVKTPEITYDGFALASLPVGLGSGVQPIQTSTHTYKVDGATDSDGYTYNWSITNKNETVNYTGYEFSLTFNATDYTVDQAYTISVTKLGASCSATATKTVTVRENTYLIDIDGEEQCHNVVESKGLSWKIDFGIDASVINPTFDYQIIGPWSGAGVVRQGSYPVQSGDPTDVFFSANGTTAVDLTWEIPGGENPNKERIYQLVISNASGDYYITEKSSGDKTGDSQVNFQPEPEITID